MLVNEALRKKVTQQRRSTLDQDPLRYRVVRGIEHTQFPGGKTADTAIVDTPAYPVLPQETRQVHRESRRGWNAPVEANERAVDLVRARQAHDDGINLVAAGETPYSVAVVELDEGPRMMTNIVQSDQTPEALRIDMALEVVFTPVGEDIVLPLFKPVGAS